MGGFFSKPWIKEKKEPKPLPHELREEEDFIPDPPVKKTPVTEAAGDGKLKQATEKEIKNYGDEGRA